MRRQEHETELKGQDDDYSDATTNPIVLPALTAL